MGEHDLGRRLLPGQERDPDARGDDQLPSRWEPNRLTDRIADPSSEGICLGHIVEPGADHDELVAGESTETVVGTDHRRGPRRDRLEDPVADRMTERVVDRLEPIQVEHEHRDHRVVGARRTGGVRKGCDDQIPVREPGERIMCRLEAQLVLDALALGDLEERPDDRSPGPSTPLDQWARARREPASRTAVVAADDDPPLGLTGAERT